MALPKSKTQSITLAEFEAIYAGRRYEFVDGYPAPMGLEVSGPDGETVVNPAKAGHGVIVDELQFRLGQHIRQDKLGRLFSAETGFRMKKNSDDIRAADIAFIPKSRMSSVQSGQWIPFAPELAVEVISEYDRVRDVRRKTREYLDNGTLLLWLVYPDERIIEVYRPGTDAITVNAGEHLDGGDVLPGLSIEVKDIFAPLDDLGG